MIENKNLEQVQASIADAETCIINITAQWCSDCTDQAENLVAFSDIFTTKQIPCYTLSVQQDKNTYLSPEHQSFTESFGGHGFPRTVLVINGKVVDADNIEIITKQQLAELSQQFVTQLP